MDGGGVLVESTRSKLPSRRSRYACIANAANEIAIDETLIINQGAIDETQESGRPPFPNRERPDTHGRERLVTGNETRAQKRPLSKATKLWAARAHTLSHADLYRKNTLVRC